MKNTFIYFSRAISAFCLFLLLTEANVWLDTSNNTLFVLGYRLFILATPFLYFAFKHKITFIAFLLSIVGLCLWLNQQYLLGTTLIALGLAVSGYMLKYYAAFTTQGAAGNKIALNIGSLLSGVMILMTHNQTLLTLLCIVLIVLSALSFYISYRQLQNANLPIEQKHFSLRGLVSGRGIAWSLVGFVIGVKLIAFVSILPQFAMQHNAGKLPHWFGWILVLNSLVVVVLQAPVMRRVQNWKLLPALLPLFIGMLIIAASPLLPLYNLVVALLWTLALSLVECTISYLDKYSQDQHCLLFKEAAVGLGSAATVYFVRALSPEVGSVVIGFGSIALLLVALGLFRLRGNT